MRVIGVLFGIFPFFYLQCDFGDDVAIAYSNLSDSMYQKSWYLCPIELQKGAMVIMLFAQQPTTLEGFASLNCSRTTFQTVEL